MFYDHYVDGLPYLQYSLVFTIRLIFPGLYLFMVKAVFPFVHSCVVCACQIWGSGQDMYMSSVCIPPVSD